MFKKFTDTLSGTIDTVKSYGSSMGLVQTNQATNQNNAQTKPATTPATGTGKLTLNLPSLGNGSLGTAPTTPEQNKTFSSNPFLNIQNTIGKITGRGDTNANALVVASHQSQMGRGPALGRAVETNESRITNLHTLEDHQKVSGYHDITSYNKYKTVTDTGQMRQLESQLDYGLPPSSAMNGGGPKLVRSNTDEIIDQEFAAAKVNLDDVLDIVDYPDELGQAAPKKDDEEKKKKKKPNKCVTAIVNCLQDNRVKGGCVDPEEMAEATEANLVLKKVLNILFLITGILLFLSVFAIVIYTSYVPAPSKQGTDEVTTSADIAVQESSSFAYNSDPNDDASNEMIF